MQCVNHINGKLFAVTHVFTKWNWVNITAWQYLQCYNILVGFFRHYLCTPKIASNIIITWNRNRNRLRQRAHVDVGKVLDGERKHSILNSQSHKN